MRFDPYKQGFSSSNRPSPVTGILQFLKKPHVLNRTVLFLVCCYVLYLLTWLYMYLFAVPLKVGETDFRFFIRFIALPSSLDDIKEIPWTIFSHSILHTSFTKLLFNVFALAVFGKLFFDFWHTGRFLFLLTASALSGAAAFVFAPMLFPALTDPTHIAVLTGANAAILGLIMYVFVHMPEHKFVYMMLVTIKMKYVVLLFVIFDLLFYSAELPAVHIAHLGGAIFGASFAFTSKFFKKIRYSKPKMNVHRTKKEKQKNEKSMKTKTDEEYLILKKHKQDRLDAILEKISKSGYGSLSQEEKDYLFYESKR